jgi:hypothetical protein
MGLNDVSASGKSQTCTPGARFIGASFGGIEGLKNSGQLIDRDADTRVSDHDLDHPVGHIVRNL